MPAHPHPVTRRTTLGGALLGLGVVAGCDFDPPGDGVPAGASRPVEDPDSALVAQVVRELTRVADLVAATGARSRGLRAPLAELRALHVAHGAALGATIETTTRAAGRPGTLVAVRTQERRLQSRLADSSVAAESGALARLLASMSAGVAQALTQLPAGAVPR